MVRTVGKLPSLRIWIIISQSKRFVNRQGGVFWRYFDDFFRQFYKANGQSDQAARAGSKNQKISLYLLTKRGACAKIYNL